MTTITESIRMSKDVTLDSDDFEIILPFFTLKSDVEGSCT